MRSLTFLLVALLVGGIVFALALMTRNEYVLFAGFVVLQYIVLATAWNILGGYCGYVNFGTAAFLAMAVVLQTLVINWDFVGGSRGAYIIRPDSIAIGPISLGYIQYLFGVML